MFDAVRRLTMKKRKKYCTRVAGEEEDSEGQGTIFEYGSKWILIVNCVKNKFLI